MSLYDVTSCLAAWSHVLPRGSSSWSNVPSRRAYVQGGLWGWGSLSGDGVLCLEMGLSVWEWGVSVQRGSLSRRGLCPGRSMSKGDLSIETPEESEMRAIRILGECFLVVF